MRKGKKKSNRIPDQTQKKKFDTPPFLGKENIQTLSSGKGNSGKTKREILFRKKERET